MPHMRRIQKTAVLVASLFLIFTSVGRGYAQRRPRLKAPAALLEVIDKADRDCVTQSGLAKSVTVRPIKLARDRTQQLLIEGAGLCLCGAQNCAFWIYRKSG